MKWRLVGFLVVARLVLGRDAALPRAVHFSGDLRVTFAEPWPERHSPPRRFIDGKEYPPATTAPRPLAGWDFLGLTVGTHRLRIEHPALVPVDVEFSIHDGRLTQSRWVPDFKSPPSPR